MGHILSENGIEYELRGEQYYPILRESEQTHHSIGKYGSLRLAFIKEHRKGTYTTLLTQFKLNEYLHEIDAEAAEQVRMVTKQLADSRGISESLKSADKHEKYKYSYGRAFKMELISNTMLKLPATDDGNPDWNFMEQYIKSLNHKPLSTANGGTDHIHLVLKHGKTFAWETTLKLKRKKINF